MPYRGGALAITDLLAGNIHLTFEGSGPLLPHLRAGKLRPLAVTSSIRIADLPDVPTMAEAGYPDVLSTAWTALFAPAGTSPAIVARLNAAINEGLATPELKAALAKLGNRTLGGRPEDVTARLQSDIARWRPIVQSLGLKAE